MERAWIAEDDLRDADAVAEIEGFIETAGRALHEAMGIAHSEIAAFCTAALTTSEIIAHDPSADPGVALNQAEAALADLRALWAEDRPHAVEMLLRIAALAEIIRRVGDTLATSGAAYGARASGTGPAS